MNEFVKHIGCDNCGSKDNRGVWDDGHEYCFGCHDYKRGTGFKKIEDLKRKKNNVPDVYLPNDVVFNFPEVATNWLNKYGITTSEAHYHHFAWSEAFKTIVMPIYDTNGDLKAWQGRTFDNPKMKYYTRGKIEDVDYVLGKENSHRIVVVEDMLSAIKVGRQTTVMSLFGSTLSNDRMARLGARFYRLVMWLDRDKSIYAAELYQKARLMFDSVSMVIKERDPKEYTDTQIEISLMGK